MTQGLRVTRGSGFLERFLALRRARHADRLIPEGAREGRILDIGCGSYPLFLEATRFAEKFGIDRVGWDVSLGYRERGRLSLVTFNIEKTPYLPFRDNSFDIVTMLAVFEHIAPSVLPAVLCEVWRVLKEGGMLIITTPAAWTHPLLALLARIGAVSSEEIEEHKDPQSLVDIGNLLQASGFNRVGLRSGYFELGMNSWVTARR